MRHAAMLLLMMMLAACSTTSPAPGPQPTAWRNRDGTPADPARFAEARSACEQAVASARSTHSATSDVSPPSASTTRSLVAQPSINDRGNGSGSSLPPPAVRPSAAASPSAVSLDRCLEAQGFVRAP